MRDIPFGRPVLGDEEFEAVREVLEGPILAHGPRVVEFEHAFANRVGAPEAVAVSSCTAGMHLFWLAVGIGPGDEVLVPAQTHVATAHAVKVTGATPVFVDAEPRTGNLDLEAAADAVTERTVGIALVHFLGEPVDMDSVGLIADRHDLTVLEDCALALGSTRDGTHVGLFGDAGAFSFYPVKHMTTAEGGMVVTRDEELARELRLLRAFGVDKGHTERSVPGRYDVVRLGLNYRMNEIQAALGIAQLGWLDEFLERRRRNFTLLARLLEDVDEVMVLTVSEGRVQSSYYCLGVILSEGHGPWRAEIVAELRRLGIGTSVYYPRPVPMMSYYREAYGFGDDAFPVATRISDHSIALPVGPHLDEDDMCYIAAGLRSAIAKVTS